MKKLLPPILFLFFIVLILASCWLLGSRHNLAFPYSLLGIPWILIGYLMAIKGKKLFKKLDTNIMTFEQPDKLVTEGLYRFSRNPMYLGFVIALIGVALVSGAAFSSFLWVVLFVIITNAWYIAFEEKVMVETFGQEYEDYCKRVRRWI
ncbi:putative membrane protein [Marinomonas sp. MED121]|uniref:methyltransferase family protein n=1 Tax=Marinomonas sp. MED121 TaxID=314277 RepID=UPI00006901C3|nr:isoprenylcysteine carboxylmethyltransferase family protein [Marinomonas sp. MED121]EAQ64371.1 putative membrane protein [Marinomonas sp. MED121]